MKGEVSAAVEYDNHYYITGYFFITDEFSARLIKLSAIGEEVYIKKILHAATPNRANDLILSTDNQLLITGSDSINGDDYAYLRKLDLDGNVIGEITSGGFGPTVGGPVAMGYVPAAFAEPGTEL